MGNALDNGILKNDALFAVPNFIGCSFSAELCVEAESAKQYRTPLVDIEKRIEYETFVKGRPNVVFDIPHKLQAELKKKISDIKPSIEKYFSVELGEAVDPHVTIWKQGDYIGCHVDAVDSPTPPQESIIRIILLLFLNDNADDEDESELVSSYTGGNLTIYGLIKDKVFEKFGYPFKGKTGTLIAFRSSCIHEVTQIMSGTRYVLKSGYY